VENTKLERQPIQNFHIFLCTDLQILQQSCQLNKVSLAASIYKICRTTTRLLFMFVFSTSVPHWISYLIPKFTQPSILRSKMGASFISMLVSVLQIIFTSHSLLQARNSSSTSPIYTSRKFRLNNI